MTNELAFLDKAGRFVVPAGLRKQMGWNPGDKLTLEVVENELRVVSVRQAILSAQELVSRRVPAGLSLADELIRERREEVLRDEEKHSGTQTSGTRELESARG
jgi:AbrB family looped-hinge helix DNA binding protein